MFYNIKWGRVKVRVGVIRGVADDIICIYETERVTSTSLTSSFVWYIGNRSIEVALDAGTIIEGDDKHFHSC